MNLDQITTKCWILALFERDDGERLLLGDGWFDFKDSLQHFQPNTFANDVIELQGSDGQMLAGQVRRGAPQSFDGYIGDPITNRQTIEQHRREFLMFFRKRHHYKVVYIFPDGTAIQRKQGYITDAPSVPEIRQRFPEYHVALNFEDVNYYEYAENAQGEEIFSNIRNINISTAATGGLVWDNLGAVSDQMGWKDIATATGQMLTMTNPENIKAPIASFEMTGNATQSGTPTPSAPVPVQTVTGRQTVTVTGKNLINTNIALSRDYLDASGNWTTGTQAIFLNDEWGNTPSTSYTFTASERVTNSAYLRFCQYKADGTFISRTLVSALNQTITTTPECYMVAISLDNASGGNHFVSPMLELGSQASTYEPYKGQDYEINLGKNLIDYMSATYDSNGGAVSAVKGSDSITFTKTWSNRYAYSIMKLSLADSRNLYGKTVTVSYNKSATIANIDSGIRCFWGTETGTTIGGQLFANLTQATGAQSVTFNVPATPPASDKPVLSFLFYPDNTNEAIASSSVLTISDFQIELGDRATDYSAYFEPIELCKIGTYQDRIYKENGKWWLEKQTGKAVLNGSEEWEVIPYGGYTYGMQEALPVPVAPSEVLVISDHFSGIAYDDRAQNIPNSAYMADWGKKLNIRNTSWATVADLKTWLASNNVSVYYVLATPTTTEITNEEVLEGLHSAAGLKLFPGQNNITDQTPNAQPTMTVQYYTALGPGGGLVWESGEAGGATIIEASGLDSAFPLWTVPGPSTNPTLTNITTGQSITWQGTVPAGQTLEIDMDKQTATLAGANVYAFVSGDWIRIDPGSNRMTYVGTGATQASTLSWNNIVG